MIELYKRDAKGAIRVWRIHSEGQWIIWEWGLLSGEEQNNEEHVPYGLAGRTIEEQIESRINSRVSKQRDKGYVNTIEQAKNDPVTNTLGFMKPMLAQVFSKQKEVEFENAFYQYKYNGHRCMIHCENGIKTAYSRNGKVIDTIPELLDEIIMEDDITLDGELYLHNTSLQKITSLVKKRQPDTLLLKFLCYDVMISDMYYPMRHEYLRNKVHLGEKSQFVPTFPNVSSIHEMLKNARSFHFEGVIMRLDKFGYEDGKRSKSLLKIKQFLDIDVEVLNITSSREGWAILHCITSDKKVFRVSAPGTMDEKHKTYELRHQYIGKCIRIEFAEWTDDKVPFHPVAKEWAENISL